MTTNAFAALQPPLDLFLDLRDDVEDVVVHVHVREANDLDAKVELHVAKLVDDVVMVTTIDLDREARGWTIEVHDLRTKWMLTTNSVAERLSAKQLPEQIFFLCGPASKLARAEDDEARWFPHN